MKLWKHMDEEEKKEHIKQLFKLCGENHSYSTTEVAYIRRYIDKYYKNRTIPLDYKKVNIQF